MDLSKILMVIGKCLNLVLRAKLEVSHIFLLAIIELLNFYTVILIME